MQKRVVGLPFYQFPEVGKLIKPDGHNLLPKKYNITVCKTATGHEHKVRVTFNNSFVPVLTDGLTTVTAGVSLFSLQRTESGTGSRQSQCRT